jgi:hypothetical protein
VTSKPTPDRNTRSAEPDAAGSGEGRAASSRGLRMRDEDHARAAFGLSGSPAQGGDQQMRGGYGGEGYRHYGADYASGAQGGAGGPAYAGDYGSSPDGTPRQFGSEGEENYDRGIQSADQRRGDQLKDAGPGRRDDAKAGHVTFGNSTAGLAHDGDGGCPAGTEAPVTDTGMTGGAAGTTAGSPSGGRQT